MSGRLPKNTSKMDASNNATCLKTRPKMDSKIDKKIDGKTHLGTLWHHWASLWPPWEGSGGTPRTKMYKIRPETCFRTRKTCTTATSENIPWETAIRKLTIVASLQCADKTAGRKVAMVASSQRADNTGPRKFTVVVSLQQLSWKPPAASKFL